MDQEQCGLYKELEVAPWASQDEIRKAWHKNALKYHPDKNNTVTAAGDFIRKRKAYEVLNDPQKRMKYDLQFSSRSNRKPASSSAHGHVPRQHRSDTKSTVKTPAPTPRAESTSDHAVHSSHATDFINERCRQPYANTHTCTTAQQKTSGMHQNSQSTSDSKSEPIHRAKECGPSPGNYPLRVSLEGIFHGTIEMVPLHRTVTFDGKEFIEYRQVQALVKRGQKKGTKVQILDVEEELQHLHIVLAEWDHPVFRRTGMDLRHELVVGAKRKHQRWERTLTMIDGQKHTLLSSDFYATRTVRFPGGGMPSEVDSGQRGMLYVTLKYDDEGPTAQWED